MVQNAGTQIAEGLRPVVATLGANFFTNTVTIRSRVKSDNVLGEPVYQETDLYSTIPAMIVKVVLNAGREEQLQGDIETASKLVNITLGGYYPEITLDMKLVVDQDGRKYDILGIDHPATAMTQLVAVWTNPQGET